MKKITRIFALALALVMAFALQAPVNAAEKAAVPVMDREMEATTMMTDVINQNFAPYYKSNKEITYQVAVPSDVTGVQVILYNYKGKKVSTQNALSASYGTVIRYVRFKIAKNQTYTVKVRMVCIPSSRQLKKYKIFVLPGVYGATFLCRQSLLFMKFHWC